MRTTTCDQCGKTTTLGLSEIRIMRGALSHVPKEVEADLCSVDCLINFVGRLKAKLANEPSDGHRTTEEPHE